MKVKGEKIKESWIKKANQTKNQGKGETER